VIIQHLTFLTELNEIKGFQQTRQSPFQQLLTLAANLHSTGGSSFARQRSAEPLLRKLRICRIA
jgi:hypothetical protein